MALSRVTAASVFGGPSLTTPPPFVICHEIEYTRAEVKILTPHPHRLAAEKPTERDHMVDAVEPVTVGVVEKPADLLGGPHHDPRGSGFDVMPYQETRQQGSVSGLVESSLHMVAAQILEVVFAELRHPQNAAVLFVGAAGVAAQVPRPASHSFR